MAVEKTTTPRAVLRPAIPAAKPIAGGPGEKSEPADRRDRGDADAGRHAGRRAGGAEQHRHDDAEPGAHRHEADDAPRRRADREREREPGGGDHAAAARQRRPGRSARSRRSPTIRLVAIASEKAV